MKNRIYIIRLLLVCILFVPQKAYAEVYAVKEPFAEDGCVYVAGNPDFYPLEYYDSDTKSYKGIMPELLRRISERTGVDFVYIDSGMADHRETFAKNQQVELVSGYFSKKDSWKSGISKESRLYTLTIDGEEYDVSFAFTKLASEKLIEEVETEIASLKISAGENMAISTVYEIGEKHYPFWPILIILLFLNVTIVFVVLARRRYKNNRKKLFIDEVTGWGNKEHFRRCYNLMIKEEVRPLYYIIYIAFDIKRVNTFYGEHEANSILRYEADMISSMLADTDFFGRITEEGFAVGYQAVSREKAETWVKNILDEMNEYNRKLWSSFVPVFSAGIYQLKIEDDSCDMALHCAKQGYRYADENAISYVITDEAFLQNAEEKKELQLQCIQGIENQEFECFIQFIEDTQNKKLCAAEVLSRWQHSEKGFLMPGRYISEMEKNGTISELDYYILKRSFQLLQQFENEGAKELSLLCNVSRKTFSSPEFIGRLQEIAAEYPINRSHLYLEVTENSLFDNRKNAIENIRACKEMGFMISLEVGKGNVPFSDLYECPVDIAKFDRELLLAAAKEEGKQLLEGINELFHRLNIRTICERVETEEQYNMVKEMEIDYVQGYYIQRVLPVEEGMEWFGNS